MPSLWYPTVSVVDNPSRLIFFSSYLKQQSPEYSNSSAFLFNFVAEGIGKAVREGKIETRVLCR